MHDGSVCLAQVGDPVTDIEITICPGFRGA
jgi:hypothetical protein